MRRLFIIRKDLHLSSGKLAAMVSHCAEAYWTRLIKNNINTVLYNDEEIYGYMANILINKNIYEKYINGIFTKTICEAKNLNHLMKAKIIAEEFLNEKRDKGRQKALRAEYTTEKNICEE